VIHPRSGTLHGLQVKRYLHMAAAKTLPHRLPDLRLERLEPFGNAHA
jgi:hypothetical protein